MKIYVVIHAVMNYECENCSEYNITQVTTNVTKVIDASSKENPHLVEIWEDGEYCGEVREEHFDLSIKELKQLLLDGGV